jgi:hypothetical protein
VTVVGYQGDPTRRANPLGDEIWLAQVGPGADGKVEVGFSVRQSPGRFTHVTVSAWVPPEDDEPLPGCRDRTVTIEISCVTLEVPPVAAPSPGPT